MIKKIFLFGVALLAVWQLGAAQSLYKITVRADGAETSYAISNVQKIVFATNHTMTVKMKTGGDKTDVTRVSFDQDLSGVDYTKLKINEVSGVGNDSQKFYELINIGTEDIPLLGCKLYYNANKDATGGVFPPDGNQGLTWTGTAGQTAEAGKFFSLIGRDNPPKEPNPGSFTTGLTAQRKLIITLEDPKGNIIDQCARAEDTGIYEITDKSFSRIPDGTGEFYFTNPTPNAPNGSSTAGLLLVPQTPISLGLKNQKADASIFVFPNPVKEFLTVNGVKKDVKINLCNLDGSLLQTLPAQENSTNINVSALPQGVYLLQVGNQFIKFIKQ